mgnify:CR=1 FL=1
MYTALENRSLLVTAAIAPISTQLSGHGVSGAQPGTPDGDGYGGSGKPLRCETSPVPFAAGDVGMALAGRDTGSSQVFVTLSRTPHLDGEYTRLGRAEGDFDKIKEGDVVTDVVVDAPK